MLFRGTSVSSLLGDAVLIIVGVRVPSLSLVSALWFLSRMVLFWCIVLWVMSL